MKLPGYVEIEPDVFQSIVQCNYAEVVAARDHEHGWRRRSLDRLLRLNGEVWKSFPSMTVGDMMAS